MESLKNLCLPPVCLYGVGLENTSVLDSNNNGCYCDWCISRKYRIDNNGWIDTGKISANVNQLEIRILDIHNKETQTRDQRRRYSDWVFWKRNLENKSE